MQERREEAESCPPIARRRDAGGVQQRRPHRALHPSPRTACAPCPSRRAVNAAGGGAGTEAEEGAGARRLRAPSSARDAAAAESLSLGHVIVSKREPRGSPASRGPLQNAARRARRCHSRRRLLSSSRLARESGGSCGADGWADRGRPRILRAFAAAPSGPQRAPRVQRPRPAAEPGRAAAAETKLSRPHPAPSDHLQLSPPLRREPPENREPRAAQSRASFSLPRLSPPGKPQLRGGLARCPAGGQPPGAGSLAAPASGSTSANSDLKGQSPARPVLPPSPLGPGFPRTEKKSQEEAGRAPCPAHASAAGSGARPLTTWGEAPRECGRGAGAPRPPLCARVGHRPARSWRAAES
ncbi:skin secretory protein xP2-like [Lynx canadensis]|uniref:skin secretory protein xP2-like n=1 Tax=Lynx canadensis TaxID=61383 RepID=UPI0011B09BCD|nr:skin secretory protein xP2-like [Lynx canadensis]